MKNILLCAILISVSGTPLFSQLLGNRLDVSLGYHKGRFEGKSMVTEGSFIYPALLSNLEGLAMIQVKAAYKIRTNLSAGLSSSRINASGWQLEGYTEYADARFQQHTFAAFIRLHTRMDDNGWRNRIRLFADIGPSLSFSRVRLQHSVFFAENNGGNITTPLSEGTSDFGITSHLGIQYNLNRIFGAYIGGSLDLYRLKAHLYNERQVFVLAAGAGLVVRLIPDKFYY